MSGKPGVGYGGGRAMFTEWKDRRAGGVFLRVGNVGGRHLH